MNIAPCVLNSTAERTLRRASEEAARVGATAAEPEHLLAALLSESTSSVNRILRGLQIDPAIMLADLRGPTAATPTKPPHSDRLRKVVLYAEKEAQHLRHRQIDALHLLLGILYDDDTHAAQVLTHSGLSLYDLRAQVMGQPAQFTAPVRVPLHALVRPSPVFLMLLAVALGSGGWLFFNPPALMVQPLTVLFVMCGWVVALCIHEFSHAAVAYLGGDDSVVHAGYLTLNPIRYTHPVLSIFLPLLFMLVGGIGLPGGAVYINRRALRGRWWETFVSAAGPLGTLVCGALLIWPFFFDWWAWVSDANMYFWPALALLVFLQVTSLIFNLLPIPTLDGFGMIAPWLSLDIRENAYRFGQIVWVLMLVVLWQDSPLTDAFWRNMYGFAGLLQIPADLVDYGWAQFYGG